MIKQEKIIFLINKYKSKLFIFMNIGVDPIYFDRRDFRSVSDAAALEFNSENVAQRADQSRKTADTKTDGLSDILERLNKLAAKPVESDDSEAGFKFSSSSRVIKATDLDDWSKENLGQLIKILEKIKISDLVANKDSISVEERHLMRELLAYYLL